MTFHLHHGDCLPWLATLADKSADVTISDPPYEAQAHTQGRRVRGAARNRSRGVESAPIPFAAISESDRRDASREIARLTRRWALIFCQVEAVQLWAECLAAYGHEYVRTCIWVKPDGMPQLTGDRPGMGYEALLVTHPKGRKRWNGGGRVGIFTHNTRGDSASGYRSARDRGHPTQKPTSLMLELTSLFSDEGETILDPFAGSASGGVAALRLGRHFIGAEMDAAYHAIATERLTAEAAGTTLQAARMKQTSMFGAAK